MRPAPLASTRGWRFEISQLTGNARPAAILYPQSRGRERIVALGVNWYLNRNIRVMLDDNIIRLSKGTVATSTVLGNPDRDSQDINVIGLRFQYAN